MFYVFTVLSVWIIPSIKGTINRKNLLIREELDDGTICTGPVQQLFTPVQADFFHYVGKKMPLILCKKRLGLAALSLCGSS